MLRLNSFWGLVDGSYDPLGNEMLLMSGYSTNSVAVTQVGWLVPYGLNQICAIVENGRFIAPTDYRISLFRGSFVIPPTDDGVTFSIAVRPFGGGGGAYVPTGISFVIGAGQTSGSNLVTSFDGNAGDELVVQAVRGAGNTNGGSRFSCSFLMQRR